MKELDVLCVGGMVSDVMMKPIDPIIFQQDKTLIDSLTYGIGGDAANQALVLHALGNVVGIATAPGEDDTGRNLTRQMKERGIDVSNCVTHPGTRTRTSFVMIHGDGERNLVSYQTNMGEVGKEDLSLEQLDHTRMVSIGSIFMYEQLDRCLDWYLGEAKKRGVITAADTMSNLKKVPLKALKPALAQLDYFVPSYVEALDLTGEKDAGAMADCFLDCGVKNVIIKLGTQGCLVKNENEQEQIPIFPAKCVDSTGAGDNFTAGFLTGILKGWSLSQAATLGAAAGSVAVGGIGANSQVKSFAQVAEVMEKAGRGVK